MKSVVATLCLGLVLFLAPRAALGTERRLGVVDLQRAIMEVEEGKIARALMQKEIADAQRKSDAKVQDARKQEEAIARAGDQLTSAQKQQAIERLQKVFAEITSSFEQEKALLGKREQERLGVILRKLEGVVTKVAADRGFTMVLDKRAVVLGDAQVDITDEVIRVYNTPLPKP